MNVADRIYLAVHLGFTLLVCLRHDHVPNWPAFVVWNVIHGADPVAGRQAG